MKSLLVKREDGLFSPAYPQDYENLKKIASGSLVTIDDKDVRNIMHHRKFFALLNLVVHHLPENLSERLLNVDFLLHELKIRLGHYDLYVTPKGNQQYKPRSISFQSMGQSKFEEFYSQAIDVILKHYLKGWDAEQIEKEILNFF